MTYQELIWKAPTKILREQIDRDRRAIKVAERFLTPDPELDLTAGVRNQIKALHEDIQLISEELELRKRPGPRDWSPRG